MACMSQYRCLMPQSRVRMACTVTRPVLMMTCRACMTRMCFHLSRAVRCRVRTQHRQWCPMCSEHHRAHTSRMLPVPEMLLRGL